MDWTYVALIVIPATILIMMIQRADPKRCRLVSFFVVLGLVVIRHNAFIKGDLHEETLVAYVLALVLNFFFWILIGRYNPVDSGDKIDVIGMDD